MSALKSLSPKPLLLLGALLLPGVALAQDRPPARGPAAGQNDWPQTLKHRNARYAVRERVLDEAGDARERVLRDLVLTRTTDPLGDREEVRRAVALRKQPPQAVAHAQIARAIDRTGDAQQDFVAKLARKERRHAELRRFRDFAGDQQELALFRINRIRFGPLDDGEILHADEKRDRDADRFFNERGEDIRRDNDREVSNDQDLERRDEREADREDERGIFGKDDREVERVADRAADRAEREGERDDAQQDKDDERRDDQDAEKLDKDAERDLERKLDKGDLDSDRDTERQIQREDENNDLDD